MLSSSLAKSEDDIITNLSRFMDWDEARTKRVTQESVILINAIRDTKRKTGSLESFFEQYALNTDEGLALMCLAEALLRIPDSETQIALIEDKISGMNWLQNANENTDWLTRAAGLGLNLSVGTLDGAFSKLGEGMIRKATMQAMRILGKQFVLGENIGKAIKSARRFEKRGYNFSYDMLGEGARTTAHAETYFTAYQEALTTLANNKTDAPASLSVKLSALHPRFEFSQEKDCLPTLTEKLLILCTMAAQNDINLTIDAEEHARLNLTLELVKRICTENSLKDWDGFGLAVQAYQKCAMSVVEKIISFARNYHRKIHIRLVKGAYWDTEIKHAQIQGHAGYPVFTRKTNTDLSYLACAQKLLSERERIYPMFATHNAHTICSILDFAQESKEGVSGFEFQKLFGMGDTLYDVLLSQTPKIKRVPVRIYAPVGQYRDLLPYLVRRLLENGANSSFVNKIIDKTIPPEDLSIDPLATIATHKTIAHPAIPLPENLYGRERKNSIGLDLSDRGTREQLLSEIEAAYQLRTPYQATPLIGGKRYNKTIPETITNPANTKEIIGTAYPANQHLIEDGFIAARRGYHIWSKFSADKRAKCLERLADLLEENRAELVMLCIKEAGKTIPDSLNELREAVDFCRYYAAHGRRLFNERGTALTGPTGEDNIYTHHPRGIFVCVSPWNFPLAIFTGQITAALMAGNAVIAKPAEQTPLIAMRIIEIMHESGITPDALILLPGDRHVGESIIQHQGVCGVAFTGSTAAAQSINRTLAAKDGAIVPLIAETGGQNAMIVDSSALTEQVIDDVIAGAFGAAGQRCSATRILCLQDDIAEQTIQMLKGAMALLNVGAPGDISTDIGPIIDEPARAVLQAHKTKLDGIGQKIAQAPLDENLKRDGHFFAPCAYEIDDIAALDKEIFGPILHIVRYKKNAVDDLLRHIHKTGYGLTFGLHSRIDSFTQDLTRRARMGNIYVNKSTIGAVVGVQPFGGRGLSGTGPKAGGLYYLPRFACEKVVSTNTAATGGNTSLMMLED